MREDMSPYKCRSLDVIRKAYDAGFWVCREEEALLLRFRASVRALHAAAHPRRKLAPKKAARQRRRK